MKNGEQKDLGCDGNGKRVILVKVKKFREPAKMFIQCGGCAKCESRLTKRAADCLPCGHPKEAALQMEFGSWSCQMCKAANSR